jgi:hypothetical protein
MGINGKGKRMMKSPIGLVFILVAAFFLLGMGNIGQTEKSGEIPVPDKEVAVVITDSEGLTQTLNQFSINGQTYLTGKLGAGRAVVPFDQIRMIHFSSESKGVAARVELTDHSQMNLFLEKGVTAYGKIKAGTYQILLDHLKKIEIQGIVDKKKEKDRT